MKIIIFTEGQTDWRHIKKAQEILGINMELEYWDADDDRGDDKMLKLCQARAAVYNENINIFIFDRDNLSIASKVSESNNLFKKWGNNVFSFCIPVPKNRTEKDTSLSIEFYYKDDLLFTPDNLGKRLFCSDEFDENSGRHKRLKNISYGNHNKLKGITTPSTSKILDSDVFNEKSDKIALSKNAFTEYIVNEISPFINVDFCNFNLIFDVIKKIFDSIVNKNSIPIDIIKKTKYDHPPVTDIFVGRDEYIQKLLDPLIRVATITGFGGEGKSSLAAKIYKVFSNQGINKRFERVSWVDCKDEETTFHEKLLGILEALTEGEQKKTMYADENVNDTISRLLDLLNRKNCFIVFDNVDAFVDKDKPTFTGHVKFLFDAITSKLSSSYVIFTCRSSISDHHFSFLEIPVQGLSYSETLELAQKFNINVTKDQNIIIKNIYEKTKGHALWLNLIFGQLRNNRLSLEQINTIISKQASLLNIHLLNSIWDNLNKNEKEIISIICTFTRPPTLKKIEKATKLTYQKCVKVLNTLLKLRLVLELDQEGDTHYDLHPIIRIKAKESLAIKKKLFVVQIIKSLADWNKLIGIVSLYDESMPQIEDYIECTEIAIENNEYKDALKYLDDLSVPLLKYGLDVKYVELCEKIFKGSNFVEDLKNIKEFSSVYSNYINTLLIQDEFDRADCQLDKFAQSLASVKDLIAYSAIKIHVLWFQNKFQDAIEFANDAINKIIEKGENVPNDIYYDLALAHRDLGKVDEALSFFLEKMPFEKIDLWDPISKDTEDISADVGNISRCYYLLGEYLLSLKYCMKSSDYLEKGKSRHSRVNYGYSLLWLADTYFQLEDYENTRINIQKAVDVWKKYCPSRLKKIRKHMESYPKNLNALISSCIKD